MHNIALAAWSLSLTGRGRAASATTCQEVAAMAVSTEIQQVQQEIAPTAVYGPGDLDGMSDEDLLQRGRDLLRASRWLLGDIAARLVKRGMKLEAIAAQWDMSASTLRSWKSVAMKYPAAHFDRLAQPWAVYEVFASREDKHSLIGREQAWTVEEARQLVAGPGEPGVQPEAAGPDVQPAGKVSVADTYLPDQQGEEADTDVGHLPPPVGAESSVLDAGPVDAAPSGDGQDGSLGVQPEADPEPCARCAPRIELLEGRLEQAQDRIADLEGQLAAQHNGQAPEHVVVPPWARDDGVLTARSQVAEDDFDPLHIP
jgi:hypothetical protein